ncbi:uncharacterized protein AC631_01066 [Debaryomyces fabryi]|uniref:Ferric oxidoreductase domain-containing protein n=1 Tax=Debaryomyces fabryi TaxID=58627 RepID=A0A0V1Q3S6_9ASCO|nr:uncharacterized protein AC631_01066 [Debaryomyces fabryi]KSA03169.1 hypothetical protein AC631_01066 [Debaryomyces fabryi]CUM48447.1 unnamed protein product [Debaryomyces fabryi]
MDRFKSLINLFDYFHYPTQKSKEYSKYRQELTNKYGDITTIILVVFLIAIPIQKLLNIKGYTFSKIKIFKKTNLRLNKWIERDEEESYRLNKLKRFVAGKLKGLIYNIYYHATAILLIIFWGSLLTLLSLNESNHGDLIVLAKRLGKIITVSMPTIFFLTLRPSPLPNTLYLALLPVHKWLSRLIIVQGVLHTVIYCGYFQYKNTWGKAIKYENLYGWGAMLGFLIIMVTSLLGFRTRYYRFFYFQHYVWSWIIVICIQIHARPVKATPYTIANICILVGQIIYRLKLTDVTINDTDMKVTNISSNLALVEFPNHLIKCKSISPGAHIRLTEYGSSWFVRAYRQIIPNYHPYTLVSLPLDNYQKLIVRRGNFQIQNNHKYLICGSYDPNLLFLSSRNRTKGSFSISKLRVNAKRILMIVGGSAISFALPILRVMNYHGVPIKIVWVIKDFRDITILKHFDGFIHEDDFEIFVTGSSELSQESAMKRYGSINDMSSNGNSSMTYDLESEQLPLLGEERKTSMTKGGENEDVEISIDNEEDEDDDECAVDLTMREHFLDTIPSSGDNDNEELEHFMDHEDEVQDQNLELPSSGTKLNITRKNSIQHSRKPSISLSRKTSVSTTNEIFCPILNSNSTDTAKHYLQQFKDTVKKLKIEHRIYKGRPRINYKYYNWCINEGFTQCSGPVDDGSHNFVCCRDLIKDKGNKVDSNKVWVITAGPAGLVKNVKLWANENGLNFHEESFYV